MGFPAYTPRVLNQDHKAPVGHRNRRGPRAALSAASQWLAAFAWAMAVIATPGCSDPEPKARRVLLVGWDGATFDLIDPLLERGELPHLAALIANGRSAELESTKIPISSAAWPTIATGKGPGEHGVYSFFRPIEGTYDAQLVSSMDVASPPIWRILSERGRRVNVFGVPVTYPAEPINGTMVSGMLSPFDADYAHPEGTANRLREAGFIPDLGIWRQNELANMDTVKRQLDLKEAELLRLAEMPDWSLSMFVFKSLDVLCHRPSLRLDGPEITWTLKRLDEILGKLIEAAGDDTVVMVISDHGFAQYSMNLNLHRWLIDKGYAALRPDATLNGSAGGNLSEMKATERAQRIALLDLEQTQAFADAAEGPFGGIRLNLMGREPKGQVTKADKAALMDAIEKDLRRVEFPQGMPVVLAVHRGAELYPGPFAESIVPDLIVELRPDVRCVASLFGPAVGPGEPAPFPDHALDGIWVLSGNHVLPAAERTRLRLEDIAPMVLHALGEPIPRSFGGDPQPSAFEGGHGPARINDEEDESLVPTAEAFRGRNRAGESGAVRSRISEIGYGK